MPSFGVISSCTDLKRTLNPTRTKCCFGQFESASPLPPQGIQVIRLHLIISNHIYFIFTWINWNMYHPLQAIFHVIPNTCTTHIWDCPPKPDWPIVVLINIIYYLIPMLQDKCNLAAMSITSDFIDISHQQHKLTCVKNVCWVRKHKSSAPPAMLSMKLAHACAHQHSKSSSLQTAMIPNKNQSIVWNKHLAALQKNH